MKLYNHLIFVIHEWDFKKTPLTNFCYNTDTQKHYRDGGKALLGCKPDNQTTQSLKIGGSFFSFHVNCMEYKGKPKSWELTFWDISGNISLYNITFPVVDETKDIIPNDAFERIIEILKDYSKSFIRCTKCSKRIPVSEIAGSYFAGRYCDHCWNEGGMKEKEAKETYN
jgi:hypothetical protein